MVAPSAPLSPTLMSLLPHGPLFSKSRTLYLAMAWEKATWAKDLFILSPTAPIFLLTSETLESMSWHTHSCMTWQHDSRDSWQRDVLLWWRCPVDPAVLQKIFYVYPHYWGLDYLMKQKRGLFTYWGQGYFKWEDRNHRMIQQWSGSFQRWQWEGLFL